MRLFLIICICTLTVPGLFSQDTVYAKPGYIDTNGSSNIPSHRFERIGCNHGHICCLVYCSCCPFLFREQMYDSIFHPYRNGIQRITVVERYSIAISHQAFAVHFLFRDTNAHILGKWYCADLPYNEIRSYKDYYNEQALSHYPKDIEAAYLKNNTILVQDSAFAYHLIDLSGKVIPMQYAFRRKMYEDLYLSGIIHKNQIVYGFTSKNGDAKGNLCYTWIDGFDAYGVAIAINTKREFGLVDTMGNVLYPYHTDKMEPMGEGRFLQKKGEQYCMLNHKGKILATLPDNTFGTYSEGLAFVSLGDSTIAYLDMQGKRQIQMKAKWGRAFHDGKAAVHNGEKWGYIDTKGKLIIEYLYDDCNDFEQGRATVAIGKNSNIDTWYLIDSKGKKLLQLPYDELYAFKKGKAMTFKNGIGYGFIDSKGNILFSSYVRFGSHYSKDWFIHGAMVCQRKESKPTLALINANGIELADLSPYTAAVFIQAKDQSQEYLPLLQVYKADGMQTIIDLKGKQLCRKYYDKIEVYSGTLALGLLHQRWRLIRLDTGEEIKVFEKEENLRFEYNLLRMDIPANPQSTRFFDLLGNELKVF